jgi:2'-5' RNA ligase
MKKIPDTIRCFVAVYPDRDALEAMAGFVSRLRARNGSIRWERPGQMHITMKFAGDVPRERALTAADAMRERIAALPDFSGIIDIVGAFPNFRRPRIIWLGFSRPAGELTTIQAAAEEAWAGQGVARERNPFKPHFTIGRVKENSDTSNLENDIAACSFSAVPVSINSVRFMESKLTPAGAVHSEFARIDLNSSI